MKNPRPIARRGQNQLDFDDAILPVFCPTCQTADPTDFKSGSPAIQAWRAASPSLEPSGCTMTRSIRSTKTGAPSSPFSIGCAALPQPRSRMALAADTRAAGVASSLRMMPTRTRIAVLVWLRASDRISVSDRTLDVFLAVGERTDSPALSHSTSSLKKASPKARLRRGPRARAISDRRSLSLHEKKCAADRVTKHDRFGREPYLRSRRPQRREQMPSAATGTFARARPAMVRTTARRSALQV
jgi:hypothetical protein